MALISRFSRLLKADVHAVLDRLEEPEIVLRQAVRDMDEEYQHGARQIDGLEKETHRLQRQLNDLELTIQQLNAQLDDCFEAKREDLARSYIKQRLEQQHLLKLVTDKFAGQTTTINELKQRQQSRHTALAGMRQKLDVLARSQASDQCTTDSAWRPPHVNEDDVELELVREKKRRSTS